MKDELIRAKIYKELYREMASLVGSIRNYANNKSQHDSDEEQRKALQTISEMSSHAWYSANIQSHEDRRKVELLQYLIDDEKPIKP